MDNVSALPRAAQQKMQSLQSEIPQAPTPEAGTPPTPPVDAGDGQTGERVTLTREEVNDLRAAAGRTKAAEGREEALQLKMEELSQRLTELQSQNKSVVEPKQTELPPATPAVDTSKISFTEQEIENYGETREFIEKVVDLRVGEVLNRLLPGLQKQIAEAKESATSVGNTVATRAQQDFQAQVVGQVPNIKELVRHKHWEAFLDETEEFTGNTFSSLIAYNVHHQKLAPLVKIYKAFEQKYVTPVTSTSGYNGAAPDGGATQLPPDPNAPKPKLKMSDRRRASEDYRMKRNDMTWDKLQEINKKFEEAEKAGNIEYD